MDLSPHQRAYVRKRTMVHEPDPSEMAGELNIVPFLDIVVNIIIFLLATTQAVLAVAEIDAQLPSLGRRVGNTDMDQTSTLNLSVTITRNGVIVGATGAFMAPGCTTTVRQGTITIPSQGGRMVWQTERRSSRRIDRVPGPTSAALTQCARRIKDQFPDETRVIVSADPEIEFEHLVGAMDALRADGTDELFPQVLLSAGVR